VPVRDLSDDEVVERSTAVARRTWPGGQVRNVRRLEGGVSSLTFAADLVTDDGERGVVLKFAPPGLEPVRNRDVLRQARILDRLSGLHGFPVPAVLMRDEGSPPDIPPMFGMELRPGQAYEPMLDVSDCPPTAPEVVVREHALARALAVLHTPTPAQLGLADEPVCPAAEELERWSRLLATVDPDIAVGHEKLADRLARDVPADIAPSIVHGDYRAANMLFVGPELEAVIDWEIWSVGDPRPDLAWILMHTDPSHTFNRDRSAADLAAGAQMPLADQLLATYLAARTDLGATERQLTDVVTDLPWFLAVSHYKVASTIAVIWKRERKRSEPDPKLEFAVSRLDAVLEAGHVALDARLQRSR
jgi:aminoglycoside phosphotransferase (APT) family kinase protein